MTRATRSAGALCADCGTGATGVVPNPFAGRASERQLPDARVAMRGTRDLGKQAVAAEGRQVHMRRFLTALGPNPAEDDRPRWTFVDSMARPLGVPESAAIAGMSWT
jgi:hypothetical protein